MIFFICLVIPQKPVRQVACDKLLAIDQTEPLAVQATRFHTDAFEENAAYLLYRDHVVR
jgi:hypothetical protein